MTRGVINRIWRDERGAVAASYAIALPMLIVVAGVGFDYARMVSLDSELQNAADQAALAGVTQLDGQVGACQRAADAAREFVNNQAILSDDQGLVTLPEATIGADCGSTAQYLFWQDADKTVPATSDVDAAFIEVIVNPKTVTYALTPVTGAVFGETLRARAMAGIQDAICKTPPVMMCNPAEPAGNTNTLLDFDADAYKGIGIRLVANDAYTPGSFGFLETGFGNGANNLLAALGWTSPPGNCIATTGVNVKPGIMASVMDGLNTRFDIPGTGNSCPTIGGVAGACPPSINVRKDLVRGNSCSGPNAWDENPTSGVTAAQAYLRNYRPTGNGTYASLYGAGVFPEIMGHPRDLCHAHSNAGSCPQGRFGTGDWDINAYWRSNYGTDYPAGLISTTTYGSQPKGYPTRYQVYRWEADQLLAGTIDQFKDGQGGKTAYTQPQASQCLALPTAPYGLMPTDDGIDRRRITVAVLNCNALQADPTININSSPLPVGPRNWVNIFLVEPSKARDNCKSGPGCNVRYTEATDVYVEVIGRTDTAGDEQTVMKNVPYLIQ